MTSKQYMMCVTSVDPYWLGGSSFFSLSLSRSDSRLNLFFSHLSAELGSVFFSVRSKNFDGRERNKAARDFSKKAEPECVLRSLLSMLETY